MSGWSHNRLVLFVCAGLLLAGLGACGRHQGGAPGSPVLRISQRNEPATLDPQRATLPDEFFVIRALSEGLVTPNPDGGAPLPGVAEKWETSADGRTWTFHLRTDARWSNGDPVTAADFVWSIRRALTPATAAPKAALFFALRGAHEFYRANSATLPGAAAPDARTLVLTLERPTPDLLVLAASGPWIPIHPGTVEKFGRDWTRPEHFVGNGPFTLTRVTPNQLTAVSRNARYWDAAAVKLDSIEFLPFDSGDSEERAFRAGQVDVTMAVPVTKLAAYRAERPSPLHTVPLHETRYLVLNTTRPPLDDARVRRALALALDRTALVEKVLLTGRPAFNFVPAGLGSHVPDGALKEDAAEARRLLAAAGFPEGRGFPKLELATWPVNPAQLEAVQQMWRRELGLEIALAPREARTHLASLAAGDFALAFMTAIPDYDSAADLLTQLTGGHPLNYPHWRNAEFDRLVAAGAYPEAEQVLLRDLPVIPLYFNAQNFLVAPRVHGWRADALWTRFYRGVSVDPAP